jgi:hypothetical protein
LARLEDVSRGASVTGILPNAPVTVVDVALHGSNVVELTYKDQTGRLGSELLFRDREPTVNVVEDASLRVDPSARPRLRATGSG